jgi:outer membrane receptor for ferrienterochelin and colicin
MVFKKIILIAATGYILLSATVVRAQLVTGSVSEMDESGKTELSLPGATVHISGTDSAASADADGKFSLRISGDFPVTLVASFIGYQNDTAMIMNSGPVKFLLRRSVELKEVNITANQQSLGISKISVLNTEKITEKEILKAACCNLSESFETNPTVNVAYSDAVTGAKEIQMLGLSGIYSQLLTENIPDMRGIAASYGLTFIPGPWMESIQVTKGTGSVLNGYESTSGQLNVEFKKPQAEETPRFYLNLFGEANSNMELNTFFKKKLNDRWSSILMLHGNYMDRTIDNNGDGFHDLPHSKQINVYNRWQYNSGKKMEAQIGLKFLADKRHGGQIHSEPNNQVDPHHVYLVDIFNRRVEAFGKLGLVYPEKPSKSLGNIVSFQYHDLDAVIGLKNYDASEKTVYYQSIYQNIIGTTDHEYKTGISFQYDRLDETYQSIQSVRARSVAGVFVEYTYSFLDKFKAVAGMREDYNSKYDFIFTPRLHLKYNFTELAIVRASAGKSFREPYLIADNLGVMASSKYLMLNSVIDPEIAWNYGLNYTQGFILKDREGTFNVDFYRTDFTNQLIVDRYSDSLNVRFSNLEGTSYSNSFQVSLSYEFIERLELRLAYKVDDVKSTYNGKLQTKPLIPKERILFNVAYMTENEHWKFDGTLNWVGTQQLASTTTDPEFGKMPSQSPSYSLVNFQVTKVFRHFELYGGSENVLDFTQEHPIIAASEPFSAAFDATNVWGPVDGIRIYAGLRYQIK